MDDPEAVAVGWTAFWPIGISSRFLFWIDRGGRRRARRTRRIAPVSTLGIALACIAGLHPLLLAAETAPQGHVLEDFEGYALHMFPPKWRVRNDEARKLYRIEKIGRG